MARRNTGSSYTPGSSYQNRGGSKPAPHPGSSMTAPSSYEKIGPMRQFSSQVTDNPLKYILSNQKLGLPAPQKRTTVADLLGGILSQGINQANADNKKGLIQDLIQNLVNKKLAQEAEKQQALQEWNNAQMPGQISDAVDQMMGPRSVIDVAGALKPFDEATGNVNRLAMQGTGQIADAEAQLRNELAQRATQGDQLAAANRQQAQADLTRTQQMAQPNAIIPAANAQNMQQDLATAGGNTQGYLDRLAMTQQNSLQGRQSDAAEISAAGRTTLANNQNKALTDIAGQKSTAEQKLMQQQAQLDQAYNSQRNDLVGQLTQLYEAANQQNAADDPLQKALGQFQGRQDPFAVKVQDYLGALSSGQATPQAILADVGSSTWKQDFAKMANIAYDPNNSSDPNAATLDSYQKQMQQTLKSVIGQMGKPKKPITMPQDLLKQLLGRR